MITLVSESARHDNTGKYAGQYIARITGRNTKWTFQREFLGKRDRNRTFAYVDEPGLFEICNIDRYGQKRQQYKAIIARPKECPPLKEDADPDLLWLVVAEGDAARIARRLENENINHIVGVVPKLDSDGKATGYAPVVRSKREALRASTAATIDSAVEHCWQVLQSFPAREARKVLALLKERVRQPEPEPAEPEAVAVIETNEEHYASK